MKKIIQLLALSSASCIPVLAQNGCGNTLNWTNAVCQQIGSGSISSQWTVISRHGEYGQSETECNIPSAISTGINGLVITTSASAYTCGDFNPNTGAQCSGLGSPCPSSFPYSTGDVQWNTFNYKFGTLVWQSSYPASSTNLWPSHWMLATNCQNSNKYTGDTSLNGCPNFGATGYDEIDLIECYAGSCNMNLYHNGTSQSCFIPSPNWDTASHTWMMIWTSSSITLKRDGTQICNFSANIPQQNMFLIMQIQTGGVGGTPTNAQLPASLTTNYVKVCSTTDGTCSSVANNDASVTFYDNFSGQAGGTPASIGLWQGLDLPAFLGKGVLW